VLVWLGTGSLGSDRAIACIEKVSHRRELLREKTYTRSLGPLWSSEQGREILDLLQRGYWQRVWIVQETALARSITVRCGDKTMDWSRLKMLDTILTLWPRNRPLSLLPNAAEMRRCTALSIINGRRMWRELQSKDNYPAVLDALLRQYRHQECHDARDGVYGYLGLVESSAAFPSTMTSPHIIVIDYAWRPFEIFAQCLRVAFPHYRRVYGEHPESLCRQGLRMIELFAQALRLSPSHWAVRQAKRALRVPISSLLHARSATRRKRMLTPVSVFGGGSDYHSRKAREMSLKS
jgi:hypothetical protein